MPRFNLDFDKGKQPKPGTYFCTKCNHEQKIKLPSDMLVPCPKCGGHDFATP